MSNFRENIMSANLIARIESLIRVMKSSGAIEWDSRERKWFAELLSPFSGNGDPESCHLIPSPHLSPYEGGIILEMFSRDIIKDHQRDQNKEKLIKEIKSLFTLCEKLNLEHTLLDKNDKNQILELAIKLRRHMLDSVPNRAPINIENTSYAYAW